MFTFCGTLSRYTLEGISLIFEISCSKKVIDFSQVLDYQKPQTQTSIHNLNLANINNLNENNLKDILLYSLPAETITIGDDFFVPCHDAFWTLFLGVRPEDGFLNWILHESLSVSSAQRLG